MWITLLVRPYLYVICEKGLDIFSYSLSYGTTMSSENMILLSTDLLATKVHGAFRFGVFRELLLFH